MVVPPRKEVSASRIEPVSPAVPARVIVRPACDFFISVGADGIRNYGGLKKSVFKRAIALANVEHRAAAAIRAAHHPKPWAELEETALRPVSILALSLSMKTPFETTRRHVAALVHEGYCTRTQNGVTVSTEALSLEATKRASQKMWLAFWEMIYVLRAQGFDFESIRVGTSPADVGNLSDHTFGSGPDSIRRSLALTVITQFYITCSVDGTTPHGDDWSLAHVYIAIIALNNRGWKGDKVRAWLNPRAGDPLPNADRIPASIGDTARLTGHGKELTRRKLNELVHSGRVERIDDLYIASPRYIEGPENVAGVEVIVKAFYRMVYDLTALGLIL